MKRFLFTILLLVCMLLPVNLLAKDNTQDQADITQLEITLNEYREKGYELLLGPIQYLGKSTKKIMLYRHGPLSYRILDSVDEAGEVCSVKKHDFVYVLSKHGHVILICFDREDRDNA